MERGRNIYDYDYHYFVKDIESESERRKTMKRPKEDEAHRGSLIISGEDELTPISSPPTKIRRLDVEFSPRPAVLHCEHEDGDVDRLLQQQTQTGDADVMNEERALVLYRPMPMVDTNACNPSFCIASPHLIPALTVTLRGQVARNDAAVTNDKEEILAVVPWAPNKLNWDQSQEGELCSMEMGMETQEEKMEVEDEGEREQKLVVENANNRHHNKHCMAAQQFPLNSAVPATAVTWSSYW